MYYIYIYTVCIIYIYLYYIYLYNIYVIGQAILAKNRDLKKDDPKSVIVKFDIHPLKQNTNRSRLVKMWTKTVEPNRFGFKVTLK